MSETEFIADQLRRSYAGEAWHGPSLSELLADVDEDRSARRTLASSHTIREIVLHITSWQAAALRALTGGDMPPVTEAWDGDWPRSDKPWSEVPAELRRVSEALAAAVAAMPADLLQQRVPGRDHYNYRFLLSGVVQHNLYHAGQIALLKK